jgi:hypothetical protein
MANRTEIDAEVLSKKEMKETKGGAAIAIAKEPKLRLDEPLEPVLKEPALPVADKR